LLLPALRVESPGDWCRVDRAIAELPQYAWVVFTSANGVNYFFQRIAELGRDSRVLGEVRIAAIGSATAQQLEREARLRADLVPDEASSESLVAALGAAGHAGRVLLLRAEQAREALPEGLRAAAISFDDVPVYRMVDETHWDRTILDRMTRGDVDWITMTSPRIVRSLAARLPPEAVSQIGRTIQVASISPLTSAAIRDCGWEVSVESRQADMDSLIDAIVG